MNTNHSHHELDPDLRHISSSLDRLAASDARAASPALEERLFAASRTSLSDSAPAPLIFTRSSRPLFALAAGLLIVASAAIAALFWLQPSTNLLTNSNPTTLANSTTTDEAELLRADFEAFFTATESLISSDPSDLALNDVDTADPDSFWGSDDLDSATDTM